MYARSWLVVEDLSGGIASRESGVKYGRIGTVQYSRSVGAMTMLVVVVVVVG